MDSEQWRPTREVSRPTEKVSPQFERVIVLPLEGKGDRSAVDEVTCTPAPPRGAFVPICKKYRMGKCRAQQGKSLPNLSALKPSPIEGKGDRGSGG